jgi:short subunit dehydrogenase-like uncharacterized protein
MCQTYWSDGKRLDTVTPVTSRIVLFGATGYTGELTARALVKRGRLPVLAGRNAEKLKRLAADLGGLEIAVAEVRHTRSISALLDRGDVLISTVGPFQRWGRTALTAAVRTGAHYVDSAGEPPFIQDVFENWAPRARTSHCALLTAMAYRYVLGNLAAALALRDAGPSANRVEVGYFIDGPITSGGLSGGSRASMVGDLFESGFARRDGVISAERAGLRRRAFTIADNERSGLSLGGSEHFALPQTYPSLRNVDVYLGWAGPTTRKLSRVARAGGGLLPWSPVKALGNFAAQRLVPGSTGGPDQAARARYRTVVVAETFDAQGNSLARAVIEGLNPYDFTGEILAWTAERVANVGVRGVGALGPVAAFGLNELAEGVRQCGIERTE